MDAKLACSIEPKIKTSSGQLRRQTLTFFWISLSSFYLEGLLLQVSLHTKLGKPDLTLGQDLMVSVFPPVFIRRLMKHVLRLKTFDTSLRKQFSYYVILNHIMQISRGAILKIHIRSCQYILKKKEDPFN
jgi:hypothetical protein